MRRLVTQHDTCGHIDAWIPTEAFDSVSVSCDMQRFPPKLSIRQVAALHDACDRWLNWKASMCPVCEQDYEWGGASPWEGQQGCCEACRLQFEADASIALEASHPEAAEFALATALPLRGASLQGRIIEGSPCPQHPSPYEEQMDAWVAQQQRQGRVIPLHSSFVGWDEWEGWDDWEIRLYALAFREYGPYVG